MKYEKQKVLEIIIRVHFLLFHPPLMAVSNNFIIFIEWKSNKKNHSKKKHNTEIVISTRYC